MKHDSTPSPLPQPNAETLSLLRLMARLCSTQSRRHPLAETAVLCLTPRRGHPLATTLEDGWFDEHPLSSKAI